MKNILFVLVLFSSVVYGQVTDMNNLSPSKTWSTVLDSDTAIFTCGYDLTGVYSVNDSNILKLMVSNVDADTIYVKLGTGAEMIFTGDLLGLNWPPLGYSIPFYARVRAISGKVNIITQK
jgi:hypothetical protein